MKRKHRSPRPTSFCREDARRYQFLRENHFAHWQSIAGTPDKVKLQFEGEGGSRAALDAAIDAAIAKRERAR